MSTIDELLQRVEAATGPDRLLSADIHHALLGADTPYYDTLHSTASIDAALALVDRVLPGMAADFQRMPKWARAGVEGPVWSAFLCDDETSQAEMVCMLEEGYRSAISTTLPLAILAALLTAIRGATK